MKHALSNCVDSGSFELVELLGCPLFYTEEFIQSVDKMSFSLIRPLLRLWIPKGEFLDDVYVSIEDKISVNVKTSVWSDRARNHAGTGLVELYSNLFETCDICSAKAIKSEFL